MEHLILCTTNSPTMEEINALVKGISDDAYEKKGLGPIKSFGIFYKDHQGKIWAGCSGIVLFQCMYIDNLWVDKSLRNKRIGVKLMKIAEEHALQHGCTMITLITMNWEVPKFYQKLGYEIEFIRVGLEKGTMVYFLKKTVTPKKKRIISIDPPPDVHKTT